jgi:hypothetical protein
MYDDELRNFSEKCIKVAIKEWRLLQYKNEVLYVLDRLLENVISKNDGTYSLQFRTEVFNDLMSYIKNLNLTDHLTADFLEKYSQWKTVSPA